MKFFAVLSVFTFIGAAFAAPVAVVPRAVQRGATTLTIKEVGGVPGNECLTFRNNGDIVDAACVNAAADRQFTPSKLNGKDVLLVQRGFSNGFRPDLVGKQVCVGFAGNRFRAEDCASTTVQFASLQGNQIKTASGACLSGHNNIAETTVDPTGAKCASFTTTRVNPTAP